MLNSVCIPWISVSYLDVGLRQITFNIELRYLRQQACYCGRVVFDKSVWLRRPVGCDHCWMVNL